MALLTPEQRTKGLWTISAGNAGQGIAMAARQAGVPCTIVVIENAAGPKIERMRRLGARIVMASFDAAWQALEERRFPGVGGTFVHPFDDHDFIAGNATLGLEVLEDLPDVAAIIAAIGGGSLISGIASAVRALKPEVKIFGAEPDTAAPAAASFASGSAERYAAYQESFIDGAGAKSVFPRMWQRMKDVVDGSLVVSLDQVKSAMRILAERMRIIAEGAGALAVAAALSGQAGRGPIVAVVSGGNIDLKKFAELTGIVSA